MAVTLMYVDSFKKKNITELEASQLNDASNLENLLLETFQKGGVDRATDPTHLLVRTDSQYFLLPEYRAFEGNETVIYSDIPAQNNAYIYDRKFSRNAHYNRSYDAFNSHAMFASSSTFVHGSSKPRKNHVVHHVPRRVCNEPSTIYHACNTSFAIFCKNEKDQCLKLELQKPERKEKVGRETSS